ncbi:hypothetical protein [Streptomyces griseorubiginosus]|uniref:hypothetical protein n=1 Tax=Streptomyces griseorubiginosus TaxID=67304 RepID=UPI0033F90B72
MTPHSRAQLWPPSFSPAAGGRLDSDAVAEFYAAPGEPFPAGSTTLARVVHDPKDVQPNGDVVVVGPKGSPVPTTSASRGMMPSGMT